jgi:hypothetical protein
VYIVSLAFDFFSTVTELNRTPARILVFNSEKGKRRPEIARLSLTRMHRFRVKNGDPKKSGHPPVNGAPPRRRSVEGGSTHVTQFAAGVKKAQSEV